MEQKAATAAPHRLISEWGGVLRHYAMVQAACCICKTPQAPALEAAYLYKLGKGGGGDRRALFGSACLFRVALDWAITFGPKAGWVYSEQALRLLGCFSMAH